MLLQTRFGLRAIALLITVTWLVDCTGCADVVAEKDEQSVSNNHKQHDAFRTPLFVLTSYQMTEQQTRLG